MTTPDKAPCTPGLIDMRLTSCTRPYLTDLRVIDARSRIKRAILHLSLSVTTILSSSVISAQAQTTVTYVSGLGKDGGVCPASAPCQTLQYALTKTLPGGQIQVLDSANYGYATINKAISIISGGSAAGVLSPSNVSGLTISAGVNDTVNLSGLVIDGAGSGANGILFTSGASLNVQDTIIRGFATGINFQSTGSSGLFVSGTLLTNNMTGLTLQSTGRSTGVLSDVQVFNNGTGIATNGPNGAGQAILIVQNSVVANNTKEGVLASGYSDVTVASSTVTNNVTGVKASSANSVLRVSMSTVAGNIGGWSVANGGQVISLSTNSIGGNINGDFAPPTTIQPFTPPPPPPPPDPVPTPSVFYLLDNNGGYILDLNGQKVTAS